MTASYYRLIFLLGFVAALLAPAICAHNVVVKPSDVVVSSSESRRKFLTTGASIIFGNSCGTFLPKNAVSAAEPIVRTLWKKRESTANTPQYWQKNHNNIDQNNNNNNNEFVYIGCGCFWHLQHSVAVYEREVLGRKGGTLTCQTGYAGGKGGSDSEGRVCYHNPEKIADYAKLGHGEVVGVNMPSSSEEGIVQFMKLYFSQFDAQTKERRDPMDIGPAYRSILGLSGGSRHPFYSSVVNIASKAGFKARAGKGSDPDTLGKQLVYVYDTQEFPFYQAEVYHQFHNDFQSMPYGSMYNNLANRALEDGRLRRVGCPDRV
jgi:peptide methionine sulfoxide reductase MsrA